MPKFLPSAYHDLFAGLLTQDACGLTTVRNEDLTGCAEPVRVTAGRKVVSSSKART